MITLSDFQQAIADALFSGSWMMAGLAMLAVAVFAVFCVFRDVRMSLIASIAVAALFWMLDIIGSEMVLLMIAVAGIALMAAAGDGRRIGE